MKQIAHSVQINRAIIRRIAFGGGDAIDHPIVSLGLAFERTADITSDRLNSCRSKFRAGTGGAAQTMDSLPPARLLRPQGETNISATDD